jgi:hypothetical protein
VEEEEIIEIINNLSIDEYEWYLTGKHEGHSEEEAAIVTEAIQGLLDLYEKEKEKNKELEERLSEIYRRQQYCDLEAINHSTVTF